MAAKGSLLILLALSLYTHAAELKTKEGSEENEGRYISDSQIFTLGTVNIRSLILFSLGALLVLALLAVTATTPREAGAIRHVRSPYFPEPAAYEQSQDVHRNLEEARVKYQ
ncbi:uncharacterized protein [Penaeus vannamei]|uniref:uncharacterized protein n=1 Tax=Penaeus vannamei TaxID=6689 RepID=UPI00387F6E03